MKAFMLAAALLFVACDAAVKPADTCKDDPFLNELTAAKKTWGETWCPTNMDVELREVDDMGNALCAYVSTCGVPYQISGCSPSYGIRCVKWMTAAIETDRLSEMASATKGK